MAGIKVRDTEGSGPVPNCRQFDDMDVAGAQGGSTFCPLNKTRSPPRPDSSRESPFGAVNGCIVTSPKQVQTALSERWAPVYSKKVFGLGTAQILLADYGTRNVP